MVMLFGKNRKRKKGQYIRRENSLEKKNFFYINNLGFLIKISRIILVSLKLKQKLKEI